ncbi:MAG TPA: MerR family transcriptional regulator [Firmicutes bacterium]|nr:MerR family transcriptional regulator [Bacillota bacterium]
MPEDAKRPKYPISVVADMIGVHPQTLRLYEREGLVKPQRTSRHTRLYSQEDIERLKSIINLTQDMGVNLAGVEIILRMREQMEEMQAIVEELLKKLASKIQQQFTETDYHEMVGLVPLSMSEIQPVRTVEPMDVQDPVIELEPSDTSGEKSRKGRKKRE